MNFKTLIENIKDGYFLQIGAYDGISNDEFGLSNKIFDESGHTAILVEPIPEYFDQLKKNYITAKSTVFFENIAISDEKSIKKIKLNGQDTSFVRNFDRDVELVDVFCEPFKYLVEKYNIKRLNALVIDTEAYELVVMRSVFSTNIEIDIIRYEFVHLSKDDSEKLDNLLVEKGYDVFQDENSYADKIAIKKN